MTAFKDVTVLDLTHHIAGPYATKLLCDSGARVIKVEPPWGETGRNIGPFPDDDSTQESGLFHYLNAGKQSVALDLQTEDGRDVFLALAAFADVVVESFAPGRLDRFGIGWETLSSVRENLSVVSISNFGSTGPYRDYRLSEITLYAYAGEMYSTGLAHREPVKLAGTAALFEAAAAAAVGILGGLFASRLNGIGQHVDISLAEALLGGCDRRHATTTAYQFSGRRTQRAEGLVQGTPGGVYPCADGYIEISAVGEYHYPRVEKMLDHAEWLRDSAFQDPERRRQPDVVTRWNDHFLEWTLALTKREIWSKARTAGVLCGPLFSTQDLFEDEHLRDRDFWTQTPFPEKGAIELPSRTFLLNGRGPRKDRRAPFVGEHTTQVLEEAGVPPAQIARISRRGIAQ